MIVITGASSGLGAALAQRYSCEGKRLLLTGRNHQRLFQVAGNLSGNVEAKVTDLCDPMAVSALFDELDPIPEMVIHCAGSGHFSPIEQQDPQAISALLDNNVKSTIFLLQALVKRYREHPVKVVVVMSTAAQVAKAGESTYCAAKWAVRGLVESVRLELKSSPMKLIAVYPGGMATDFWATSGKDIDTSGFMTAEEAAHMLKQALISTEHGFVSDITLNRN
ncbi:SDR family NAD(P)-dependent oxidoreductase [Photobacterium atrarenae]|uniref:SDR family NAD(P)-dependent oxidoreductase n=1 Tax=Photobacterium atrarenae TaxID=865757 RepID=A0ABY5GJM6_9GAMM|nr:SDR family NAD(P)-dependent oxidoreductase [Photobacterium atrarenae]UTV29528.1 SDR family NAD(P)-dependent oxidoreductase [Photobacterium atrarenae]